MKIYSVSVPEYEANTEPDWKKIGQRVDFVLKRHFMGQRLAIRCVGSSEHKNISLHRLINIVKKTGTDRYNTNQEGNLYKNIGNKQIDFFALDRKVTVKAKIMWQFIWSFWHYPRLWKEKTTKIDLIILYNRSKLKAVRYTEDGKRFKQDGFVFNHSDQKKAALLGLIKVIN